jgi:hypothetical protein
MVEDGTILSIDNNMVPSVLKKNTGILDGIGTILSIDNNMVPSVLKSNTGRQTNCFEMQYGWTDISNDY